MKYYKHPSFTQSVYNLYTKGGDYKLAATRILAVLAKAQEKKLFSDDDIANSFKALGNEGNSVRKHVKYNAGADCILLVAVYESERKKIFLYSGNNVDVDVWLDKNKDSFQEVEIKCPGLRSSSNVSGNLMPHHISDVVEFAVGDLIKEYANSNNRLKKHRERIVELRQSITIEKAIIEKTDICDIRENHFPENEIFLSKKELINYDCDSIAVHLSKIRSSCEKNEINKAYETVESIESHVVLMKYRIEHVYSLKEILAELKKKDFLKKNLEKIANILNVRNSSVIEGNKKGVPKFLPKIIPEKATRGEILVSNVLRKLPADCVIFYEPVILNREPDFIVISPRFGIIVVEVKDWDVKYISGGNKDYIETDFERKVSCKNPVKQAREYMFSLMDLFKDKIPPSSALFNQIESQYKGNLSFPLGHMAILTNIKRIELESHKDGDLTEVFPDSNTAYKEDLDAFMRLSGSELEERLSNFMNIKFNFKSLSPNGIKLLERIVYPEVKIKNQLICQQIGNIRYNF